MPSAANRATSVQPNLPIGGWPTAATNSARPAGPGRAARRARSRSTSTSYPSKTSRRCAVGLRLGAVRREPVVDVDHALVRDHVAGDAAADADRVEALAVVAAVDRDPARLVRRQPARAPRRRAWIALTPCQDRAACARTPVGSSPSPAWCPGNRPRPARTSAPAGSRSRPRAGPDRLRRSGQPVAGRPRPPRSRRRSRSRRSAGSVTVDREPQRQRGARLHVRGAAAVHACRRRSVLGKLSASGTVSRCPARTTRWSRPSSVRATTVLPIRSTRRCARGTQRGLDRVGDLRLVAGDGLDVDQGPGQRDRVGETRSGCHEDRPSLTADLSTVTDCELTRHRARPGAPAWPRSPPTARRSTSGIPAGHLGLGAAPGRGVDRLPPDRPSARALPGLRGGRRCTRTIALAGRRAGRRRRRVPAAAPALAPPDPAAPGQPRRHLRPADQRRLDLGRPVPAGPGRRAAARSSGPPAAG